MTTNNLDVRMYPHINQQDKNKRNLIIILFAEMAIFSVIFSFLAILRHSRVNSAMYDLGLFDQIIYNIAHGRLFESSIKGFNYLGDHFSPILILFAPLYWIWEDVRMLLIAQVVIVSLSGYFVGSLSYHLNKDIKISAIFALAILTSVNVMLITLFDFHPETILISLFAYIIYHFAVGNTARVFVASLIALTVKEDVAITVMLTSIVFSILSRRRIYLLLFAVSLLYFVLVMKVLIPYFRPQSYVGDYLYIERYSYLGSNMQEVILSILSNPISPLVKMFKWTKLKVLLRLFYPTLFMSLLSPAFLISILPVLYINWISNYPPQFALKYQYLNIAIPLIITSSVYGYRRLRWLFSKYTFITEKLSNIVSVLMIIFAVGNIIITCNTIKKFKYLKINHYNRAFYKVKEMIPADVHLATINTFGPHFTHRRKIEFAVPFNLHMYHYEKMGLNLFSEAPYQLFLMKGDTTSDPSVLRARVKELIENLNYSVIFDEDDLLLLRKNL